MKKGTYLDAILRSKQTVFSIQDVALLWQEPVTTAIKSRLAYFAAQGYLYSIRRGLYSQSKNYNQYELATKIFTPAYISLETVLLNEGVIFQVDNTIHVVTYLSRKLMVNSQSIEYERIKPEILTNRMGIKEVEGVFVASKERAMLDRLYLTPNYYFDNLRGIDWEKAREIVKIYESKAMNKRLEEYYGIESKST